MDAVWTDPCYRDVDPGDEPALVTVDNRKGPPDRRRVSLRWLAGTVLAAMASTSLMGGALYVALDGRQSIALPVDRMAAPTMPALLADNPADMIVKSDMQSTDDDDVVTRQVLKVSTITREGDADLIRMKPFARISAPLVSRSSDVVDTIPVFNPLRIFADANPNGDGVEDILYGAVVDGQMTVKITDFPLDDPGMGTDSALDLASTEQLVRDNARFLDGATMQVAALPVDPQRFEFGFADRSTFDQFGVRIIPENVSFVATTALNEAGVSASYTEQKSVLVKKDENLDALLTENEATDEEAEEIALQLKRAFGYELAAGDRINIELAPANDDIERYRPIRISVYRDGDHLGTIALSDRQDYIAAQEPRNEGDDLFAAASEADAEADAPRPRLYESLYQTALSNGMSPELINQMVRIFSFDVDLNTRVSPGDTLEVVYSLDEDESESAEVTEIIYTALTVAGKTRRFYRYKAPDDGSIDYYDEEGRSAKKFLLRKPMTGGTFRSGFGSRKHPLLGYVRAHTGVDWAAPRGTPIMASGDGVVVYADWKSGYGNYVMIRHTNGYETAYAHQTGFAKGIKKGVSVRQGQIIGYVGSTGLSTGPHLHYEVHVNNNPVDPMRIKVPRGRSLEGDMLAAFSSERERTDTLLGGGTLARLTAAATEE